MTYERIDWKPLGYELFILANLVIIYALTAPHSQAVLTTLPVVISTMFVSLLLQGGGGVIARLVVGVIRGGWREYLAVMRKPAWIVDTIRLLLFGSLLVHTYSWIKVTIPLLHPRLFDQELWDFDRAIFFGISPNIFVLNLFAHRWVLRVVDITYGNIFIASVTIAFAYFLSSPSRRLRVAFMSGNSIMWLAGAWLYMLIPSLGPAYRFPDIWMQYASQLPNVMEIQTTLWRNYSEILKTGATGVRRGPINILLGIAAFPSLHVAFQTFVFLWFRRLWTWGEVAFALFVFTIFLGSLITGWHYMIDGIAGILLAWLCWWFSSRRYRVIRWAHLRENS